MDKKKIKIESHLTPQKIFQSKSKVNEKKNNKKKNNTKQKHVLCTTPPLPNHTAIPTHRLYRSKPYYNSHQPTSTIVLKQRLLQKMFSIVLLSCVFAGIFYTLTLNFFFFFFLFFFHLFSSFPYLFKHGVTAGGAALQQCSSRDHYPLVSVVLKQLRMR